MKKIRVWIDDERELKTLLRQITQRDGQWRIKVLGNGQREVEFRGSQAHDRAMLFKLTFTEAKAGTRPSTDDVSDILSYIQMLSIFNGTSTIGSGKTYRKRR